LLIENLRCGRARGDYQRCGLFVFGAPNLGA
jgi:hypothetical protein